MTKVILGFEIYVLVFFLTEDLKKVYSLLKSGAPLATLHDHSSDVIEAIAGSLVNGRFQGNQGDSLVLPYGGVSESLTDTKLEGAFLVLCLELEKKNIIKKVGQ